MFRDFVDDDDFGHDSSPSHSLDGERQEPRGSAAKRNRSAYIVNSSSSTEDPPMAKNVMRKRVALQDKQDPTSGTESAEDREKKSTDKVREEYEQLRAEIRQRADEFIRDGGVLQLFELKQSVFTTEKQDSWLYYKAFSRAASRMLDDTPTEAQLVAYAKLIKFFCITGSSEWTIMHALTAPFYIFMLIVVMELDFDVAIDTILLGERRPSAWTPSSFLTTLSGAPVHVQLPRATISGAKHQFRALSPAAESVVLRDCIDWIEPLLGRMPVSRLDVSQVKSSLKLISYFTPNEDEISELATNAEKIRALYRVVLCNCYTNAAVVLLPISIALAIKWPSQSELSIRKLAIGTDRVFQHWLMANPSKVL
eukprot:TRINITY_DN5399_c0_g1_i1.p1 TRINITY_DN5399_c0_g1~~TRINITY_DN5399_c0_g1_i1.p1  ORF type:complete len:367 (+),score=65.02 TRINITY_DN5399_c0_g1_i1:20-1120(+)